MATGSATGHLAIVDAVFSATDLRHFEGIESDPDAPAPALALARCLRWIVRAATARSEAGPQLTAIACRRRPQRRPCPAHLLVELQHVPSRVQWSCPACGEAGVVDGWQATADDLCPMSRGGDDDGARAVTVPEEGYRLLLEETSVDDPWARVVYRATPSRDGVALSGTEEELKALANVVTAGALQETSSARKRRWRQVADRLEPRRGGWLEHSTDIVSNELEELGLVASRANIAGMISRSLATVASQMGISVQSARRYIDDEALRELAREAAVALADERPGADLHDQARTIPLSLQLVGRMLAGLAESAHVRILNADETGAHGSLQLISLVGQILHEGPDREPGLILLPQGALTRAARLLEATATIVMDGAVVGSDLPPEAASSLAAAFLEDAETLRILVSEYGIHPGHSPGR